ncbi:MAG: CoA transferase [Myxococcota bacterium]
MDSPNTGEGGFADGPLVGIRVVDISRMISGPYLTRVLADMGADVIKIEPPEGDTSRLIAPKHDRGMSAKFTFANVGKRSISIDLRAPGAAQLVLELVAVSDAVVENFRPGVMDRLGLGWDAIARANPRAIAVSLTGYGADSKWYDRRAYAPTIHAVTGILHDQSEYAGQPVAQLNDAHADTVTGLHGAVSLMAALRVADATGLGQRIEVPMFDSVLTTHTEAPTALLDPPDDLVMNPIYTAGPHGAVATAGAAQLIWGAVARTHLDLTDPTPVGASLATKARLRHTALADWMAAQPTREVLFDKLAEAGIACAPVVALKDALTGELSRERNLLVEVDDRRGSTRPVVRPPARFSVSANRIRGPAPARGEHNAAILSGVLGYDRLKIRALSDAGVIVDPDSSE